MLKLTLLASPEGYSAAGDVAGYEDGLGGPAIRARQGQLNSAAVVPVTWVTGAADYTYLREFYRLNESQGAPPFLVDLILDSVEPAEHVARFAVGTFKSVAQDGQRYTNSATLYVVQTAGKSSLPDYPEDL